MIKNILFSGTSYIIRIFLFLAILCPLVGTIYTTVGLPWGLNAVILITLLAIGASYVFRDLLRISDLKTFLSVILVIITSALLFQYSPVIEIRQDPAIYMFKAFNLIDYGTEYHPAEFISGLIDHGIVEVEEMTGYANLFNGTYFDGTDKIFGDFYPGGTHFYAFWGELSKPLIFWSLTCVSVIVSVLLFFIIRRFFNNIPSLLLTAIFLLSPVIIWFGRGPYSEPYALLCFLSIFYTLLKWPKLENLNWKKLTLIGALFILAYVIRIDMIFSLFVGIVLFTYLGWKRGLIFLLTSIATLLIIKSSYSYYYGRISANISFVKYAPLLAILTYAGTLFATKIVKINVKRILKSKFLFYSLYALVGIILLLIFRNNLPEEFLTYDTIHGAFSRTYDEDIMSRLFLVFPGLILVFGLINLPILVKKNKLGILATLMFLGLFLPFTFYFYDMKNSPQMWWALRRYTYVLLPIIYFSFCFFVSDLKSKKTQAVVIATSLLLMVNMTLSVEQHREMIGLDHYAQEFVEEFDADEYVILYEDDLHYSISTLMSYGAYDFALVTNDIVIQRAAAATDKKVLYFSYERNTDPSFSGISPDTTFEMTWQRMGENYDRLPDQHLTKNVLYKIYELD